MCDLDSDENKETPIPTQEPQDNLWNLATYHFNQTVSSLSTVSQLFDLRTRQDPRLQQTKRKGKRSRVRRSAKQVLVVKKECLKEILASRKTWEISTAKASAGAHKLP